jgi:hypothetical protein
MSAEAMIGAGAGNLVGVGPAATAGEYRVVATRPIVAGQRILTIDGVASATPCRYSVQVGRDLHVAPPADVIGDGRLDVFAWRFLNHSCRPNAAIVGRELIAIGAIAAGEEVTFDYNMTEYEMASPFRCRCGHCDGSEVRGLRFLSAAERRRREHLLERHLREIEGDNAAETKA